MLSAMKSLINDTPLAWAFVVDKSVVLRCIHCFKAFTRRLEIYILLEKMRLILSLFSLSPEEHSSESIMHFDFFSFYGDGAPASRERVGCTRDIVKSLVWHVMRIFSSNLILVRFIKFAAREKCPKYERYGILVIGPASGCTEGWASR